ESEIQLSAGIPAAFRAPGWPQGVFAVESMMDELAASLGHDPLEFRLQNERSERRKKQYAVGAELIGWNRRQPDGSQPGPVKRGFGMGCAEWPTWPTRCMAQVDIFPGGKVEVRS